MIKIGTKWIIGAVAVCLVVVVVVVICSGGGESGVGMEALQVADDYLDGKINAAEAMEALDRCKAAVGNSGSMQETLLKAYIQNISTSVFMAEQTSGMSYSGGSLLVRRNELARHLGVPERSSR